MFFNNKRLYFVFIVGILVLFFYGNDNNLKFNDDYFAYTDISKITINKSVLNLSVGNTEKLSVTLSPSNASPNDIIWVSNNKSVATVDNNGNVKAVSVGNAYIIVVLKNNYSIRAICKVIVSSNNSTDSSSNNSTSNSSSSSSSNSSSSSSSNSSSSSSSNSKTGETNKKNVKATKVVLSKNNIDMFVGTSTKLNVSLLPTNANSSIIWKSSKESVVKVNNDGTISAVGIGTAVVAVKSGNVIDKCTVTVTSVKAKEFLSTLDRMSKLVEKDVKNGKKWKYGYRNHSGSFEKARKKGNRKLTCLVLPSWALIEMGVLKSGQIVANQKSGGKTYTWYRGSSDTKKRVKKNFKFINGKGKTAEFLIKNNKLQAGDIVMWKHYHTSVYAGDKKWYDAGRIGANGATQKHPYFKTWGPVYIKNAYKKDKIRQILRFKS